MFEASLELFKRFPWVDKYRYFFGSGSAWSYREMGLNNVAFAHSQIGERERAIQLYHDLLEEFPDSGLAKAALKMMQG